MSIIFGITLLLSLLTVSYAIPILDGTTAHHRFDGIGALSAGASSRLLIDYNESYRSDILDLLFKPSFGAALHILKIEIGGDMQSTDGSEPSHMHTKEDINCYRGYEYWLIQEAKKRNPNIILYGLEWGTPRFIGENSTGFHSPDNWDYILRWLQCIQNTTGYTVDYLGDWNEKPMGPTDYVKGLRSTLDAGGFSNTLISLMDNDYSLNNLVEQAVQDSDFNASFISVGRHYACDYAGPTVESVLHKPYWSTEDLSMPNSWLGTSCWAQLLNRNYILMNMTSTIAWSLIWSVPISLPFQGDGLMNAQEPWSGYYNGGTDNSLNGPLWSTAHTTQFIQPGWRYLLVSGNGSGLLPPSVGNGSYVTLVSSDNFNDFTIVVEKTVGPCHCVSPGTGYTADGTVEFVIGNGLPGPGTVLHVWRSNETVQFWKDTDIIIPNNSTISIFVPRDSIVTISTISTASHGIPTSAIPPSANFPLPYFDNFDQYPEDTAPVRYFADQTGSFAARSSKFMQVVPADPGPNRWVQEDVDPISLIGDNSLGNITINVTTTFQPASNATGPGAGTFGYTYTQLCGRITNYSGLRNGPPPGYCLALNATGSWLARAGETVLEMGQLSTPFDPTISRILTLTLNNEQIIGWIDTALLFNITAKQYQYGLVGLGSGYHNATFDDFSIVMVEQ